MIATVNGKLMLVRYWGKARKFFHKFNAAEAPLKSWRAATQKATWTDFPSIKETFNSADWHEGLVIFDIKGNDFRLIAVCVFENSTVYIKDVMTHEEYDQGRWKERYKRFK